jgi:hypothetical protein
MLLRIRNFYVNYVNSSCILWLLFYNKGKRAGVFQAGDGPPMKKHSSSVEDATNSEIVRGKVANLSVQKL